MKNVIEVTYKGTLITTYDAETAPYHEIATDALPSFGKGDVNKIAMNFIRCGTLEGKSYTYRMKIVDSDPKSTISSADLDALDTE